jgi:alanine racemase
MIGLDDRDTVTAAGRGLEFWRGVRARALVAVIGAIAALGADECRADDRVQHPRPVGFAPASGSIEGGRLVFVDVDESPTVRGRATIICRFGSHAAIRATYDRPSGRYTCLAPAHERPEAVPLTISAGGASVTMPAPFVYVTPGMGSAPPVVIDVPALAKQVERVRAELPPSVRLCAVLKNGKPLGGLGDAISRGARIDYFAVPNFEDGIALRNAGITTPIMVLYMVEASHVPELVHYDLEPAAYSLEWIEQAERLLRPAARPLNVHLWIETGISREGVMPDEALPIARAIHASTRLRLRGIATHFCCLGKGDLVPLRGDDVTNKTALQKHRFDDVVAAIRAEGIGRDALLHAGTSDALRFGLTPVYYDMMRIGTMLFENPSPEHMNYHWTTPILQTKTLPEGWCIDYECKKVLPHATRVGLLGHMPIEDVTFLIRGQEVRKLLVHEYVVTLDLSAFPDVKAGEEVTLLMSEAYSPLDTSATVAPVTLRDPRAAGSEASSTSSKTKRPPSDGARVPQKPGEGAVR